MYLSGKSNNMNIDLPLNIVTPIFITSLFNCDACLKDMNGETIFRDTVQKI